MKNPEPQFAVTDALVSGANRMGKDMSHLKLRLRGDGAETLDCVGWGQGDWADRTGPGERVDALFAPQINEWKDKRNVQLKLKHLRSSSR